jgi:hypothetical protein
VVVMAEGPTGVPGSAAQARGSVARYMATPSPVCKPAIAGRFGKAATPIVDGDSGSR